MVACNQQLELRDELEEILTHEPGGDLVSTSQRLELAFRPAPTLFGLDRSDDAGASQTRHIRGMALRSGRHEHIHGSDGSVIAKDGGEDVGEDRLAVGASAVKEKHRMFTGNAGEAIASHALKI